MKLMKLLEYIRCPGSGKEPRLRIKNDWFIGLTGICPVCNRILPLKNANSKIPPHKAKGKISEDEKLTKRSAAGASATETEKSRFRKNESRQIKINVTNKNNGKK